jgi:hypothetical protein
VFPKTCVLLEFTSVFTLGTPELNDAISTLSRDLFPFHSFP